jgi:hypothetical protein
LVDAPQLTAFPPAALIGEWAVGLFSNYEKILVTVYIIRKRSSFWEAQVTAVKSQQEIGGRTTVAKGGPLVMDQVLVNNTVGIH